MNHNSLHIRAVPTPEELSQAYKRARLRQLGVRLSAGHITPSIRIALHCTAIALRSKQP